MAKVPGTAGYGNEAESLQVRYEIYTLENVHSQVEHLFPASPAHVLDIGAGTGRDAAGFAALGHRVVAVEPVDALRIGAERRHPHENITWIDDGLPELKLLAGYAGQFDLVMLTAVLMHLDAPLRQKSLAAIAPLLKPGGRLIMMLRHGPVPPGRTMFEVNAPEIREIAAPLGLTCIFELDHPSADPNKVGVSWTRLALEKR